MTKRPRELRSTRLAVRSEARPNPSPGVDRFRLRDGLAMVSGLPRAVLRWRRALSLILRAARSMKRGTHALSGEGTAHVLAAETCRIHGVDVIVEGHVPKGGCVLAANHVSYLDPLVVGATLGCTSIAKHEVRAWPIIGSTASGVGTIFVRRASTMSRAIVLRQAIRLLRSGRTILNFPEGTTSFGDDLLPLHRGIFGAARWANVPVVPVWIRYTPRWLAWVGDSAFLGHYMRFSTSPRTRVLVRFGRPVAPHEETSPEALADRVATELLGLRSAAKAEERTSPIQEGTNGTPDRAVRVHAGA